MGSDPGVTAGGRTRVTVIAAVALVAAVLAGIAAGSVPIPLGTVARVLAAQFLPNGWVDLSGVSEADRVIVWVVRTPRVLVAACVGACLAVAGAQMQGLFRNPLASPDVVGCSTGGALGAVLVLASGLATRSLFYLPIAAFVGAVLALFTVYGLATRRGRTPVATLLLAGVGLNALVGAVVAYVITAAWVRYEVAQEVLFWLMGGLDARGWQHVWLVLPGLVIGLVVAMLYARDLDVLSLGEEAALAVGTEVERVKRVVITGAAVLTGSAVAVSGVVGFVGLIVPHAVRLVIGPRHRRLLPASALLGATFLVLADLLARTVQRPEEVRLGIITALFGAPFFLFLLMRHRDRDGFQ